MNFLCPPATCQSRCLQKKKKEFLKACSIRCLRAGQNKKYQGDSATSSSLEHLKLTSHPILMRNKWIYIYFFTRCKRWCNEINNPSNSKKRRTKNKDYPKETLKEHNLQNSFSQPNPQPRCIKIDDKLKINNSRSLVRFHKSTDRSRVNAMPNAWSVPRRTWLCFFLNIFSSVLLSFRVSLATLALRILKLAQCTMPREIGDALAQYTQAA